MMDELLINLGYWHWLTLAVACMIIEIMLPGAAFLWLGVAAACVGAGTWALPSLSWEMQVLGFAILSIAAVVLWFFFLRCTPKATDQPNLNERGEQYVGNIYTLSQPIVNGRGRMRIGDTSWSVEGPDLPEGTNVRVTQVKGTVLVVEDAR